MIVYFESDKHLVIPGITTEEIREAWQTDTTWLATDGYLIRADKVLWMED